MALSAWQATIVNESGDVIPSAQIQVIDDATGLNADIFANSGGTPAANPFTATAGGFAQFYANAGTYRVIASDSGTGFSETWEDQRLGDAQARDTGTGADQVPTNGDLPTFGTAAQADTGTAPSEVPRNSDLGTAAYLDTGTAPSEVPTNADLGTAAQANTGTGATDVPTNATLSASIAGHSHSIANISGLQEALDSVKPTISKSSNGYWKCNYTGLIIQWFSTTTPAHGESGNINFPVAFPSVCFSMLVTTGTSHTGAREDASIGGRHISKSQYKLFSNDSAKSAYCLAVGY